MNFTMDQEYMQDLRRGSPNNRFSASDHSVVKETLSKLDGAEYEVVRLRFWEDNTVSEIAHILDLSWQEVEGLLTQALNRIKQLCLNEPKFSMGRENQEYEKRRSSHPFLFKQKVA